MLQCLDLLKNKAMVVFKQKYTLKCINCMKYGLFLFWGFLDFRDSPQKNVL